jgi:predicted NACHT family NTPase
MTREPQSEPIRIFFSYAHEDDSWRDRLRKQLRPWERDKKIECWSDRQIPPGGEWATEIDGRLNRADIILLLVSADFLDSDFCMEVEYPRAMERHTAGETVVIPVILRDCLWKQSIYNKLQAYPQDLHPVAMWEHPENALATVAEAILKAVELQREKRSQQPQVPQHQALELELEKFETEYLKRQAHLCEEYTTEAFNPDRTMVPLLEKVFVPLDLSGAFGILAEHSQESRSKLSRSQLERWQRDGLLQSEHLNIWDLLKRSQGDRPFRQMSILAKGGMGKTTLLRHIALIYGQGNYTRYNAPKLTPILLRLRDYSKVLAVENPPSLPQLIQEFHVPNLSKNHPLTPPPQWAEQVLRRDGLVMFDGFDEVPTEWRSPISEWIRAQILEYREAVFIVTSRPAGFKDYTAQRPAIPIFVNPFTPRQQQDFIQRWYVCQECYVRPAEQVEHAERVARERSQNLIDQLQQRQDELGYMAENPLLLNMLATFHRFDPHIELPKNRIELYRGIVQLQLQDRPRARGISMVLSYAQSQELLQRLALHLLQQSQTQWKIERADLWSFLAEQSVFEEEGVAPQEWFKQILDVSELLVEREPEEYEFPHLSFQGFFAATELVRQTEVGQQSTLEKRVLENWTSAVWREAVLLYTAQLKPRQLEQVIRSACKLGSEAAALAKLCVAEYPRSQRLAAQFLETLETLDTLAQDSTYQTLEALLKAQKWVKADKETERLMLAAAGKEEGQYLWEDDLLNFPCDALKAIDGLWVKYSQGRFGFSVQKQIYVECGGTLDGVYPGAEVWENFGDRVGWRQKNDWMSYRELSKNISLSSPQGIFPLVVAWRWGNQGAVCEFVFLLSHRDL